VLWEIIYIADSDSGELLEMLDIQSLQFFNFPINYTRFPREVNMYLNAGIGEITVIEKNGHFLIWE
jgi:hypothetical protein